MDALTTLLDGLHLRARLIYVGGVCGRWGIDHNSDRDVWFHLVTKGTGWIHSQAWSQPLPVEQGDLILFMPHAAKHYLSYSADELLFDAPGARKSGLAEGSTGFVCGLIELGLPRSLLWCHLPPEVVVRRHEAGDALARLVGLIIDEAGRDDFASVLVIERLCDGLMLLVLRHLVNSGGLGRGVFAALRDGRLEKAFAALHAQPCRAWTLQDLCDEVGLSKTTLCARFDEWVGCAPMAYANQLRLQFAAGWLKTSGLPVDAVAQRCGYESVSAFSRAFKRCFGQSPGAYRRSATGQGRPVDPRT